MIKSNNVFHISLLPDTLVAVLPNSRVFMINLLRKRIKTPIRFPLKSKKKMSIITSSPDILNYYINYNNSIQYNRHVYKPDPGVMCYLLKYKVKWNFKKFKYHGKGYKVKKFNSLGKVTFRFGKSHWTKVMYNKKILNIRRVKKNGYCCISIQRNMFVNFKTLVTAIKGVNKYTKRGIRLNRQVLRRRFGKISQASSVYK